MTKQTNDSTKKNEAKIYFFVIMVLLIFTFFFNFDSFNITSAIIGSAEDTYELCGESIYSVDANEQLQGIAVITLSPQHIVNIRVIYDPENNPFVAADDFFSSRDIQDRYDFKLKDGKNVYVLIMKKYKECGWLSLKEPAKESSEQEISEEIHEDNINCAQLSVEDCKKIDQCRIETVLASLPKKGLLPGCSGPQSKKIEICITKTCTIEKDFPYDISEVLNDGDEWDIYDTGMLCRGTNVSISKINNDGQSMTFALFNEKMELLSKIIGDYFTEQVYTLRNDIYKLYFGVEKILTPEYPQYEYGLTGNIQADAIIPSPQNQIVLLDFDGEQEPVKIQRDYYESLPAFDSAIINETFEGKKQEIITMIKNKMEQDYEGYNIVFFLSENEIPTGQPITRIYFSNINSSYLIGLADSVDEYNRNQNQKAIVYTKNFAEFKTMQLTHEQIAQMIANIASHELGHLLGLYHTMNPHDIMDTVGSAFDLSEDQSFLTSALHGSVFPSGTQNPHLLLTLGVGEK